MMDFLHNIPLSTVIFAFLSVLVMGALHLWLRFARKMPGIPLLARVLLWVFIFYGAFQAEQAANHERDSLRSMLEGIAPTYATELERMGHEHVRLDTPPDDPLYLSLIQAEKEWLKINPLVNDIYTFRMLPDGTVVLVVDSETDYDHNGRYEGARESRTVIGEPYPQADKNLRRAFEGKPSFDGIPYTDRWGTWVSAYFPMHDSKGRVEAVLGVDYAAKDWVRAILSRRIDALIDVGMIIFVYISSLGAALLARHEKKEKSLAQEMLLKTAAENLRLVQAVQAASDGILMTDPNQRDNPIIYANASFLKITGYKLEEVLGRNCRFLQGPETDPDAVQEIREAVREKKHVKVTILNYRKDGSKFWNGLRISPVFSKDGGLQYFLGFQADVTERMEMLEELRKSEEAFRLTLLSAPVMVWMAAADKKFVYVNRFWTEFTGRKVDAELGEGWMEGVHEDDKALLLSVYNAAFREQLNFKMEFRLRHVSGEYRWVITTGTPSFKDDGSFAGFIGSCLDVHERKKLEAQLLQAQKMETVGTLAGGIAHDLNNQLTPLSGYIDLVMKETPEGDPRRDLLVEAEQAARRCAEVVQRLMNFSRTSTQKKEWLKTGAVFEELSRLLPKFLPKTIETKVTFAPGLWPVMGNETELQTVLVNLSTNARDAMPQGGKLDVTAENKELDGRSARGGHSPGPYVLITVKDAGQGIPPHLLQKIFEPFFTTKQKGQGTGLGLAMVFRIVRDHGGWLDVSSEVGKGTTFQIYLPADPKQKALRGGADSMQALPHGTETILFVDDEEALRNLGRVLLERLGYKVFLANDGEEAVRLYQEKRSEIDAVVLDMTMPKLTGRQAMKKILEVNPSARILLASGYTSEGSAKELIQEGAVDFLAKPYTIMPLAQALRKVIGQS